MEKIRKISPFKGAGIALLSLYMCFALQLDVAPHEVDASLRASLQGLLDGAFPGALLLTAALIMLCMAAMRVRIGDTLSRLCVIASAVFLAFCTLIGKAFINPEWGYLVITPKRDQILKWGVCLPGWFMFALLMIIGLYGLLDAASRLEERHGKCLLLRAFEEHPFWAPFAVLAVCLLPVMVLSWPGIVLPKDTGGQLAQMYGKWPGQIPLIYRDSMLNNHHPILHTALLYTFAQGGRVLLGSVQAGFGLFMCMQVILTVCMLAYVLCCMRKAGMPVWMALTVSLFLGLHPRVQNLIVMVSKDMLYANAFLLFLVALVRVLRRERCGGVMLVMGAVCMMLLRNEGIYVILATMALLLLFRDHRRLALIACSLCAALWMIWTGVIFPALHISPGSAREMLSIPFQQTGRYVKNFEDEVTQEERMAIDGVLQYDLIASQYNPNISDGVKILYRDEATGKEKATYFKVWASMFFKHPMTYIEAVLENKNLWLYPTKTVAGVENTSHPYWKSELDFLDIKEDLQELNIVLAYPEVLRDARETYEHARESFFALPGLQLLTQNAPIIWAVVVLVCYALSRKKWRTLILLTPLLLQVMVIFVGPMDGESFRYSYPLLLALPIPLAHALFVEKT